MSITPQISAAESPYWIVVSDEGPATPPHKHTSYDSAYDESIRLAKLHPNLKFGVFKYQGGALSTPQTKKKTTKWMVINEGPRPGYQFYDTREEAHRASLNSWGKMADMCLGITSVEIETKADPKVTFTTYYESIPVVPRPRTSWGAYLY